MGHECSLLGVTGWTNVTIARVEDTGLFWSASKRNVLIMRLSTEVSNWTPSAVLVSKSKRRLDSKMGYGLSSRKLPSLSWPAMA
jgi:hypothetical protein